MKRHTQSGCREYRDLSRRHFLGIGATIATWAAAPGWLPRVAFAQEGGPARDVLISIFLRGGCDGLSMIVPFGDEFYRAARPNLAIAEPGGGENAALDLDGFFGLAPALAPLLPAYDGGHLLPIHACGQHDGTRSHFDAMHFMEVGKARDPLLATGWLGRHLAATPPLAADPVLRALGVAPALQRTLAGSPLALPVPDPSNFTLPGDAESAEARLNALIATYANASEPLRGAARQTRDVMELLAALNIANYVPGGGATYPDSDLGRALRASAALIRGEVGVEAIAMDLGGWDTHEQQGALDGAMAGLMGDLAAALAAFHADAMVDGGHSVTIVVMSEFGRTVAENNSRGTDHGHGNAMFVLGQAVHGGRVLADWPGLAPELRYEGQDLAVTIDYRDVLHEIVMKRLATGDATQVFPALTPVDHGVIRSVEPA